MDFSVEASRANVALQIRDYSKAFGRRALLDGAEMDISCGQRVALVGPNGCGKTTLLRDIVSKGDWTNASIRVGPSMEIGYGSQEQEALSQHRTVFDEMVSSGGLARGQATALLSKFLFSWEDSQKLVADLSGGERNRLQLAVLMAQRPNFLILDEPTNHLDIRTREAVEEALDDYEGTLLVVSHDRYFLEKVATRVVEFDEGKLVAYDGSFTDYWLARQARTPRASARASGRSKARRKQSEKKTDKSAAAIEQRIGQAEREKADLESRISQALSRRDAAASKRLARRLDHLSDQIDGMYSKWMKMSE